MCGVVGWLNLDGAPISPAILKKMTDSLAHRGPDGEGYFEDGPIGLGHRRLAVIDLTPAAGQPMATPDGRLTISYNGEIYNFRELRSQLQEIGYSFRSQSDTEVLLNAYAEWGLAALDRLNGMFALAIWDAENGTLTLARDRYGIKPLYFTQCGQDFLFSSEIKAFLEHPSFTVQVDTEGLLEYFTFQNFFTDRTLFKGVYLLPAGSWLTISLDHRQPSIHRYWDYDFSDPERAGSEEEYIEELDRLFRQAVSRQLISDVDLGSYLSGGMDSGSITAIAARQIPYLKTFTCGFDLRSASGLELSFDERQKAEYMSYLFMTEHYEIVLKSGDMERVMPSLTRHLEEPRVGQSYPNYYAARLASKFVKVVLSGGGGDEMFGGYPWRYYRAVVNTDFDNYIDKYYQYWQRLLPTSDLVKKVFSPIWQEVSQVSTRDIFKSVFTRQEGYLNRPEDYINHSLYFEARTFLHGLLVVEDKLSMAHSLETRVPFLDNDLVDFAMRVPIKLKLGNLGEVLRLNENEPGYKTARYFDKTRDGKLLLRKVMERYIPQEISDGIKQGFSAPDSSWFKGESIDYVRRVLFDRDALSYQFLDRRTVHTLVNEHLSGQVNRRLLIWSLLNFEWWLKTYLN
jgi:asparagine synthase (glutamine-hydrolysing)